MAAAAAWHASLVTFLASRFPVCSHQQNHTTTTTTTTTTTNNNNNNNPFDLMDGGGVAIAGGGGNPFGDGFSAPSNDLDALLAEMTSRIRLTFQRGVTVEHALARLKAVVSDPSLVTALPREAFDSLGRELRGLMSLYDAAASERGAT